MILAANCEAEMSFDELRHVLAIESAVAAPASILTIFSNLIPKASTALSGIISSFSIKPDAEEKEEELTVRNSRHKKILKVTENLPYMSYRDMVIMVPEGFNGNLVTYLKFITQLRTQLVARSEKVLDEYKIMLAIFLNNVDARKSAESYSVQTKKLQREREMIEAELAKFFKNNDVRTRAKFGNVVSRFSELRDIFGYSEVIDRFKTNSDLQKLLRLSEEVNDLFKLLKNKLDKNEIDMVSGTAAKNIAEGAYQTAKFLEVTSIVVYDTEVMASVVNTLAKQLERAVLGA